MAGIEKKASTGVCESWRSMALAVLLPGKGLLVGAALGKVLGGWLPGEWVRGGWLRREWLRREWLRGGWLSGGLLLGGLLLGGLLLGCPLYDGDCSDSGCAVGFQCERFSRRCVADVVTPSCVRPDQCAAAETCTPDFVCRPGSCDFHGCLGGYACAIVEGAHACVPMGQGAAGAAAMAAPELADAASSNGASPNSPDASGAVAPDASLPDAAVSDAAAASP
jgi:hypothetical protein